MDRATWNRTEDTWSMLDFFRSSALDRLVTHHGTRWAERKMRLFVAACSRKSYKVSSGNVFFYSAVGQLEQAADVDPYASSLLIDQYFKVDWDVYTLARWACGVATSEEDPTRSSICRRRPGSADLLRDMLGDVFFPVELPYDIAATNAYGAQPGLPSHYIVPKAVWWTGEVQSLAEAAYRERRRKCYLCRSVGYFNADEYSSDGDCGRCGGFGVIDDGTIDPDRLNILSDCLVDSECRDESIITHLRSPGLKYRGMWSLDILCGKIP